MDDLISILREHLCNNIAKYTDEIQKSQYEYETFGKTFEKYLLADLHPIIKQYNPQYAKNKNEYPDMGIDIFSLAVDVKCGNNYIKKGDKFIETSNSNNDYGTIQSWLNHKLNKHDHHFVIFVQYTINDTRKSIASGNLKSNKIFFFNYVYVFQRLSHFGLEIIQAMEQLQKGVFNSQHLVIHIKQVEM